MRRSRFFFTARLLLVASLVVALCGATLIHAAEVRMMSFNISKVLTYAGEPSIRILQGLKPDVAFFQEWKVSSGDYRAFVDSAFGTEFVFYRGPGIAGPFNQSNGIVSRWPFRSYGSWEDEEIANRYFDWAIIDIPGDIDLQVVSIHLHSEDEDIKELEADNLKGLIQTYFNDNHYIMVGGDLNTAHRTSIPIAIFETYLTTADGTPADRNGDDDTNVARSANYDWLIPNETLGDLIMPLDLGSSSGPYSGGIVFDSRVFEPLSAVSPIAYGDTDNGSQDHCPVMKSYDIPMPITPTPIPTPTTPTPTPQPGQPTPLPTGDWPIELQVNKTTFSGADHISITANFHVCQIPFFPYVRLRDPNGAFIYLTRYADQRTRLSANAPQRFRGGGPFVLDFLLDDYPVIDTNFHGAQSGDWNIEGGFLDVFGILVGNANRITVKVR